MLSKDAQSHDSGRDLLKLLALITMTIDHIGLMLYPQILALRYFGRLSFPLFAYLLVLGMSSTHNFTRYLKRMLIFAILSQLPYTIANEIPLLQKMNIFFTLSLGMILIYLQERNNILFIAPLIASIILPMEYGAYGLATILFLNIMRSFNRAGVALLIALNVVLIPFGASYQPLALLALPLILLHSSGKLSTIHLKKITSYSVNSSHRSNLNQGDLNSIRGKM
jgi:hypothetical protein